LLDPLVTICNLGGIRPGIAKGTHLEEI